MNIDRVNVTWIGPQGPISPSRSVAISAVTNSSDVYESTLTLSPLMSTATYTCEAIMIPVPGQFLLTSSAGRDSQTITAQGT